MTDSPAPPTSAENRLALDYREEAKKLGAPPVPIIDAHAHISGLNASKIYKDVRDHFGVELTYSMSNIHQAEGLKEILGDSLRFIAVPQFMAEDRLRAFQQGYIEDLTRRSEERRVGKECRSRWSPYH